MLPATIAFMAKFRPARGKPRRTAAPQGGVPCLIAVILGMLAVMAFLYLVMRSAGG